MERRVFRFMASLLTLVHMAMLFASGVDIAGGATATLSFSIDPETAYEFDFVSMKPELTEGVIVNIPEDYSTERFVLDSSTGQGTGYLYWKLSTPEQCAICLSASQGLVGNADGVTDRINFRTTITDGEAYVNDVPDKKASQKGGIPDSYRVIGGTDAATVTEADYTTPVRIYNVAGQPEIGSTTHGYVNLAFQTEDLEGHGSGAHSATLTLTVSGS